MKPLRPIGHIACNLTFIALAILHCMRHASDAQQYVCWVDDDGCVYLALTSNARANAVLRFAPEQRINTYRKPRMAAFPLTRQDIVADLTEARTVFAERQMHQALVDAIVTKHRKAA